jgi:hypothetical protein
MKAADSPPAAGKGDIDGEPRQLRINRGRLQLQAAVLDRLLDLLLDLVDGLANHRSFIGREASELFQLQGQGAFFPQITDTHLIERGLVRGGINLAQCAGFEFTEA